MQFLQVVKLPSAYWGMLAQLHTSACKSCPAPTGVISAAPAPIEIKLRKVAKRLDLQFDDGKIFTFSAEVRFAHAVIGNARCPETADARFPVPSSEEPLCRQCNHWCRRPG